MLSHVMQSRDTSSLQYAIWEPLLDLTRFSLFYLSTLSRFTVSGLSIIIRDHASRNSRFHLHGNLEIMISVLFLKDLAISMLVGICVVDRPTCMNTSAYVSMHVCITLSMFMNTNAYVSMHICITVVCRYVDLDHRI